MTFAAWRLLPIKEIYEGLYDGPHATPKPSDAGPVFLGIKNVTDDGRLDLSEVRHIAEEDFAAWTRRVEPRAGDVVFTYEATLDRYAVIPEGFRGCLGRRMALIRPDVSRVDTRFLLYYFFTHEWQTVIRNNTLRGATVDRIPLTTFPSFPVRVPPLAVQRRVAGILSAYDDLIENNLRRIRILEEMTLALYREWFEKFRFQGHSARSPGHLDETSIPEGWKLMVVNDVLARKPSGRVYRERDVSPVGEVTVIDQSTSDLLGYHSNAPDHLATSDKPIAIFGDHTCKMELLVRPFSVGPNVVVFAGSIDHPLAYLFYLVKSLVRTQEYRRHWTQLIANPVVVADKAIAERFAALSEPSLKLIDALRTTNRTLRLARDLLLPRLFSGHIAIKGTAA